MMFKHGPEAVREFTSLVYKQFGMRVIVLAAFLNRGGNPSMTL